MPRSRLMATSLAPLVLLLALFAACAPRQAATTSAPASGTTAAPQKVRIAYQRSGLAVVAKARREVEQALARDGVTAEWVGPFPDAPSGYEAVNSNSADMFSSAAAPAVSALVGGAPIKIVGAAQSAPTGRAILVPGNSPTRTTRDLVGRKVAVQRGNVAEYTLLKTLEHDGVPKDQVERVYISVTDAATALAQEKVDAWVTWDPYVAVAEIEHGARQIADGSAAPDYSVYVARDDLVKGKPDVLGKVLGRLSTEGAWANANAAEAVKIEGEELKLPSQIVERLAQRPRNYEVIPVDATVQAEIQRAADWLHETGVIPNAVTVSSSVAAIPFQR